ncbi:MAG: SpoIIE family protein phosphatase [Candidatus Neomarinimicrobiota bacterium]
MKLKNLLRPSLLKKFLVAFMAVSLVPLIIAEYYTLKESEKELLTKLNEEYYSTIGQLRRTIDEIYIKSWVSNLNSVAGYLQANPYMQQDVIVNFLNGNLNLTEEMILLAYKMPNSDQPLYFMKNEKINELYQADGEAVANLFQVQYGSKKTTAEGVLAPYYFEKSQRYFLPIEYPVRFSKDEVGVLRGVYDINAILNYIAASDPGAHREIYIIDENGRILFRNQNGRFEFSAILPYPIVAKFKQSLGGESRASQVEPFEYEGEKYLGNFTVSHYVNWGILVVDRASLAYALINQMKRTIFFWIILAIVLSLGFSTIFARSFSNAIRYLAKMSRTIGEGDFNVEIKVPSRDELGQLGHSLQEMANSLKDAVRVKEELFSIQQEVKIASRIQQSILPLSLPQVNGLAIAADYIPMAGVAGDFYDFHEINEDTVGVIVADVSGHGIPAALIGAMVKVAFSQQIALASQPEAVLKEMNNMLCGKTEDQFLTACYVLIDNLKKKLITADAGHPPLLIFRRETQELLQVKPKGLVIGFMPDMDFPVESFDLRSGDRVVFYTDGIIEAPDPQNELFGEERFNQLIRDNESQPPAEFIKKVVDTLIDYCGHKESFEDDVTMVVIDVA